MDKPPVNNFFQLNDVLALVNVQGTTVLIILLLILLFISFCMSGAEVAFFSLHNKDINNLKTKQNPVYKRIVRLLDNPKLLLASLLIANSIANIGIIIISNILIDGLFTFEKLNIAWAEFLIKLIAVTSVLVLFGEVMPKVMASQNNIRFAKDVGWIVEAIQFVFSGLSRWMVNYTDFIEKRLAKKNNGYSIDELYHAIDITGADESAEEKNMLKGIAKFSNITVKQIMRTRLDVSGIEYNTGFADLIKQVEELHYSRLPVYKEDLDEVAGILNTKDLLPYLDEVNSFDWHSLLRTPTFVHEQKLIEDLLREFQTKHVHFAVVVDEFGGTSGIVTLEDIIEEITGEIKDEFDDDEGDFKKLDENNYLFEGKTMINDVCRFMNLPVNTFDEVKGDSDSLAGLILEVAGEIPVVNQIIRVGDFEFTVLEVQKNRLKKIKVTIRMQAEE